MRKSEKEQVITSLQEELENANNLILTGYRGLSVKELTALRRAMREAGAELRVVKKTLFRRAIEGREEASVTEHMEGPIAVAFVHEDPVAVLKAMSAFVKTHDNFELRGGWIEKRLFDGEQLVEMASLPPREELLSRLLSSMQGPLVSLVSTLQAVPRDLVLTLQALAEKRGQEAPSGA